MCLSALHFTRTSSVRGLSFFFSLSLSSAFLSCDTDLVVLSLRSETRSSLVKIKTEKHSAAPPPPRLLGFVLVALGVSQDCLSSMTLQSLEYPDAADA